MTGSIALSQNPVGTTYGNGVSTVPTDMISQVVGDNDGWRLYGEAPSTNDVKMVFEVIDDIETGDTWLFRNKKTYSPYTATTAFKIEGNGNITANGTVTANSFIDSTNSNNYLDSPTSSVFRLNGSTAVNLSVNGSNKLVADASGIDVTGSIEVNGTTVIDSNRNGTFTGLSVGGGAYTTRFFANTNDSRVLRLRDRSNNTGNIIQFEEYNGANTWEVVGRKQGTYPFYIYKNWGNGSGFRLTFNQNGNAKIWGNLDTGGELQVGGTTVIDSSRNLTNVGDITSTGTVYLDNPGNASTSNPNIDSLGVYTTGTAYSYHALFKDGNGNIKGRITHNQYGAQFSNLSDYRAKEDYQEVENATSRLMSIPVRNFQWIGSDLRTDGFLAHEIAEVVPEAVVGEKDAVLEDGTPDYQSIDQAKLIPLLVKTIQELEARITALEGA